MEITLEKIELVKDRTGVSYREAKEALLQTDGSVVDAIILIEEQIDIAPKTAAGETAASAVGQIKELLRKGNVSRIVVKKDDTIIFNLPVTLGILGAFFLPEAAIISAIIAAGTRCSVSIIKTDGSEIDVIKKAADAFEDVKDGASGFSDDLREKGNDAFSRMKKRAEDFRAKGDDGGEFDDVFDDIDEFMDEEFEAGDEETPEDDQAGVERAVDAADDGMKEASDKFESVINEYKARDDQAD